jgi:hypothetical protein
LNLPAICLWHWHWQEGFEVETKKDYSFTVPNQTAMKKIVCPTVKNAEKL